MSWEIYASAFRDGESAQFDIADLRAVFERGALPHPEWPPMDTDFLYEDGHVRLDIGSAKPRCDTFVVYRIFGQTAVARVLEAAALFNCLIYWPAGEGEPMAAVANRATLAHLPPNAAADLNPVITDTSAAFIETVGFSSTMTREEWVEAQLKRETEWRRQEEGERFMKRMRRSESEDEA